MSGTSLNTRLAESDSVWMGPEFMCKLDITEKSLVNRSTVSYNKLLAELRKIPRTDIFKKIESMGDGKCQTWRKHWGTWDKGEILPPTTFSGGCLSPASNGFVYSTLFNWKRSCLNNLILKEIYLT